MIKNLYLYLDGKNFAEVFNLQANGAGRWSFSCRPPIFVADEDYEIFPPGGKPMRIMISSLSSDEVQSHINAVEL